MADLTGARVLILATDGYEMSELMKPLLALRDAGATAHVAAPKNTREEGFVKGWDHKDWDGVVVVDRIVGRVTHDDYDLLILPGGQMNPDALRIDAQAMSLIESFASAGKTIAAICHAPWLLIEADLVSGRRVTSWPSLRTDLINAGADWIDEAVVIDGPIVTSRKPGDLDAFIGAITERLAARGDARAA